MVVLSGDEVEAGRGRRSLSTGTMFDTQITLRKSIVWAEVVGFGFPSFILWGSCFHGAAESGSLVFWFRVLTFPTALFPPLSATLRSRTCLHLSNQLLLWTRLVYLSRAVNTDIPRNVFSVNAAVRDEHLPLVLKVMFNFSSEKHEEQGSVWGFCWAPSFSRIFFSIDLWFSS